MAPGRASLLAFLLLLALPPVLGGLPVPGGAEPGLAERLAGAGVTLGVVFVASWGLIRLPVDAKALVVLMAAGLVLAPITTAVGWVGGQLVVKVLGAGCLGRTLGARVQRRWWLLLFALVALAADSWSVYFGPSRVLVREAPEVLQHLLVPLPFWGGGAAAVGMSDLIFLVLFTAGADATGLRSRASFGAMAIAVAVSLAVAVLSGRVLPALPFISLAFVAVNLDRFAVRPRPD